MQLIALKPFYDAMRGNVSEGEVFYEPNPRKVKQYIVRRIAVQYETKVITPEVKPITAQPFRDVPVADQRPPALVALESAVRSVSDVPEQGDSDRVERAGRESLDSSRRSAPASHRETDSRRDAKRRVRGGAR